MLHTGGGQILRTSQGSTSCSRLHFMWMSFTSIHTHPLTLNHAKHRETTFSWKYRLLQGSSPLQVHRICPLPVCMFWTILKILFVLSHTRYHCAKIIRPRNINVVFPLTRPTPILGQSVNFNFLFFTNNLPFQQYNTDVLSLWKQRQPRSVMVYHIYPTLRFES